ncbi:MAG TPA: hypothetical protein PK144_06725, partial [Plasticicumulans sp.]|nr:hypothetical protein [Plasticicumulans sp.]
CRYSAGLLAMICGRSPEVDAGRAPVAITDDGHHALQQMSRSVDCRSWRRAATLRSALIVAGASLPGDPPPFPSAPATGACRSRPVRLRLHRWSRSP